MNSNHVLKSYGRGPNLSSRGGGRTQDTDQRGRGRGELIYTAQANHQCCYGSEIFVGGWFQ